MNRIYKTHPQMYMGFVQVLLKRIWISKFNLLRRLFRPYVRRFRYPSISLLLDIEFGKTSIEELSRSRDIPEGFVFFLRHSNWEHLDANTHSVQFELNGQFYDFDRDRYHRENEDLKRSIHRRFSLEHFLNFGFYEISQGKRAFQSEGNEAEILEVRPGNAKKRRGRLCLYAHYDRDGKLDPYVIRYLEALNRDLDCDIVFISETSDAIELGKLSNLCSKIIIKNGKGHDFGSWYLGLRETETILDDYENLIFANDSTYFPLFDPREFFNGRGDHDVWGVTSSKDQTYHLQSYLMVMNRKAIESGLLDWFRSQYEKMTFLTKWGLVTKFEIGFSEKAMELNLKIGAFCEIEQCFPGFTENPTHFRWRELVQKHRCPMIKVDLMRANPHEIVTVPFYRKVLSGTSYNPELIENHLTRILR